MALLGFLGGPAGRPQPVAQGDIYSGSILLGASGLGFMTRCSPDVARRHWFSNRLAVDFQFHCSSLLPLGHREPISKEDYNL